MPENETTNEAPKNETEAPEENLQAEAGETAPEQQAEKQADIAEGAVDIEAGGDDGGDTDEEVGPEGRIEILEAQVADLNDKLLRAIAETENVRRRAQRDKEDASKYAIKSFAEQMITVSDNLGRALQSVDVDARADNVALDNIVVGIEMVSRELQAGFERFGIKAIEALGQKFDPMLHEAMFEIENKEAAAGTIAQVLEVGYTLNGRTLRAAKVGITKGGPKIAVEAKPETGDAEVPEADSSRDGQTAYESKGTEPGSQLDQEL